MIKIIGTANETLAILTNNVSPILSEEINREFIFDFQTVIDNDKSDYISFTNRVEVEDNYFNIVWYKKSHRADGQYVDVKCEHVSYDLISATLTAGFTDTGLFSAVATTLLSGTGFTVGTVEITASETLSVNESTNKRHVLMQLASLYEGELEFDKYQINLLTRRGADRGVEFRYRKNMTGVTVTHDNKNKTTSGGETISYDVSVIELDQLDGFSDEHYELGDTIKVVDSVLDTEESLRIVRYSYNIEDKQESNVLISNFISDLSDTFYKIETTSVIKDELYNGCSIGPEDGFVATRSDALFRAIMNATLGFALQKYLTATATWFSMFLAEATTGNIQLQDENGNGIILDQYGMDTKFIKWFKNMVENSSFELYESGTLIPLGWSGGAASADAVFDETYSMKLSAGGTAQADDSGGVRTIVNPQHYNDISTDTRISFHKKSGAVKLSATNSAGSTYNLTDTAGNTAAYIEFDYNANWQAGAFTAKLTHGANTQIIVNFENSDATNAAYIDALIIEPDYTGKRPSFYSNGQNSLGSPLGGGVPNIAPLMFEARNTAAVTLVATAETTVASKDITFMRTAKVGFTFSTKITLTAAATITAKTYIDSAAQTYQPSHYYSAASTFTFNYSDYKSQVLSGAKTIDIKLSGTCGTICANQTALIIETYFDPTARADMTPEIDLELIPLMASISLSAVATLATGSSTITATLTSFMATAPSLGSFAFYYARLETGDDSQLGVYGDNWEGQTFTPGADHTADQALIKAYRVGDPGTVTAEIYATTSDLPTGAALASGTITGTDLNELSVGAAWETISLGAGAALTAATKYALVVRASSPVAGGEAWLNMGALTNVSLAANRTYGWTFQLSVDRSITHLSIYPRNSATFKLHLWDGAGNLLADVTDACTANQWNHLALASPVSLTAATTYVVSFNYPTGTGYHYRNAPAAAEFHPEVTFGIGRYATAHDTYPATTETGRANGVLGFKFDAPGRVMWRNDASAPDYSGGARVGSTDAGANWTEDLTKDFIFKEGEA